MSDPRLSQYDYKANSNLVLQSDSSLIDRRPANEGTGEVQSLVGRIGGRMGDRVKQTNSTIDNVTDISAILKKQKTSSSRQSFKNKTIDDIDEKDLIYKPQSAITANVFQMLIKLIKDFLDFSSYSDAPFAASEILKVMKNQNTPPDRKRRLVEDLIITNEYQQKLTDETFNEISNYCKKIDDYVEFDNEEYYDDTNLELDSDGEEEDDDIDLEDEKVALEFDSDNEDYNLDIPDDQQQYKKINLEYLANKQTRINPNIKLDDPVKKPGYHEYNIPAKLKKDSGTPLRSIKDLPDQAQHAFKGFKTLNAIQSNICEKALFNDDNLMICAPTGAGKTNVAMLCMLREIMKYLNKSKFKIIYIAPIKALAQEVVASFRSRLDKSPYNMKVDELTGDHSLDQRQIEDCHLIVCTPEKWDIITRKGSERPFTKEVKLVIFDEIHLLHNERGPVLESLVTRIKRNNRESHDRIRMIGLSATLPNYHEVSQFLESPKSSTFFFDATYRPTPLKLQFVSITEKHRIKAAKLVNDVVYEKVLERVRHHQILIFVHSRNDTMKTGLYIKDNAFNEDKSALLVSNGPDLLNVIDDMDREKSFEERWKLKELLQFGIGIHHAGMCKDDRVRVEDLFREKRIKILVCTATLAWGVNLPAHTVIIKGTQLYRPDKGRFMDLDSLDIMQMLGRAGRPQYDVEGEGIIITDQSSVLYYISLMSEQLPVESQMIAKLPDYLNAECVLGNVESLDEGVKWLSETFLAMRMKSVLDQRNKEYMSFYGIDNEAEFSDPNLEKHMYNLVYSACCLLDERELVDFDRKSGLITSTEIGRIASHYNCSSNTIKTFNKTLLPNTSEIELFRTFSLAEEFKHVTLRNDEAIDMQALINEVPHPINERYATPGANKVNALLQCYIYDRYIKGSAIVADMHFIKDNAPRLAHAIFEIALAKGYSELAEMAILLCKKIERRISECHTPLRQLADELRGSKNDKKDEDVLQKLENKSIHINELREFDAPTINEVLRTKAGSKIQAALKLLPKLEVESDVRPITNSLLQVDLEIKPRFSWDTKYHGFSERFWILITDMNNEKLLYSDQIRIKKFRSNPGSEQVRLYLPCSDPPKPFYFIKVKSDKWFGCDLDLPLRLEKIKLPKNENIISHYFDIDFLPFESLRNKAYQKILDNQYESGEFNQLQSQTFKSLYETDADILLLADKGTGKKLCADLTILRNINVYGSRSKVSCICSSADTAQTMYERLSAEYQALNITFILLTGNLEKDGKNIFDSKNVVAIGDFELWNILTLSSSDTYSDILDQFQLFIINELEYLREDDDATYEWLCSKVKINKLERSGKGLSTTPRIACFGRPVICTDDLRRWLLPQKKKDTHANYAVYNFVSSLQEPLALESNLPQNLEQHVKLEIAARTINEISNILNPYLVCSFFFRRIRVNPNYYKLLDDSNEYLKTYLDNLTSDVIKSLRKNKYIHVKEDESLRPRTLAETELASKIHEV